jgi:hypothetical protein
MIITLNIILIQQYLSIIYLIHQDVVNHYHYYVLFGVLVELNFQDHFIKIELKFRFQVILVICLLTLLYLIAKFI